MKVPIEIFNIARTEVDREAVKRWLDFIGVSEDFELPEDGALSDPALLVAVAAKRCYKSFEVNPDLNPNVTRIRKDWVEYLDNVLAVGHGSVIEHSVYTFAIENVSRVFTAEMNRHRAGWAISEGSMRFIRFGEAVPYWEPTSIQGPDVLDKNSLSTLQDISYTYIKTLLTYVDAFKVDTLEEKKHATRVLFERHFSNMRDWYGLLEHIWKDELAKDSTFKQKKDLTSLFRRGIGMGCATGGVWTGNLRAIRHVITMRCAPGAEEEILHVYGRIIVMMKEKEPTLFGDFYQDDAGFWRPKYVKV